REVVWQHRAAVPLEAPAEPWPEHDRTREGDESADAVHHRRAAKSWKPVPSDAKKLPSFARRSVSAHRESVLADPKARSKAAFDVTSAPRIADGILPNE